MLTGALAIFLSAARRVRPGAFHFSSAEFQLCLPPAPILSCTRKTTACPLQTVSAIFLKGLLPFRVPELFSPVAGGTLQIWPTGSLRLSIVMHLLGRGVYSFMSDRKKW